jgi:small subunit ribosomal protein S7
MPRRRVPEKRDILPDPKYANQTLAKFMNHVMVSGKKAVAEKIVYGALDRIRDRASDDPVKIFENALEAVAPSVEVKSRRTALAMRWLVDSARKRGEKSMAMRLAGELMDAAEGRGAAVRRREDSHRMAEANKAFAHYRY